MAKFCLAVVYSRLSTISVLDSSHTELAKNMPSMPPNRLRSRTMTKGNWLLETRRGAQQFRSTKQGFNSTCLFFHVIQTFCYLPLQLGSFLRGSWKRDRTS
ncbi:hypothetical protein MPTK1_2g04520 [Marchantia polymorpha subsp. ruderalis]|uniref:Uncharacterized protein n=1 Tax=Marchantia polymorpha TaxID=3197 RepID=A0A2R6X7S2_MARPO|nr:hypothetical protein MARPO_0031s0107 [Marchantia polymorpha]BBN01090.1 hypothetical protein Mp_2g04520 [Marchantia polymorpha subsp. ruderalis]|eukprot:PTQ42139.1 hypothetical protein MARPO_0031s0107 [Marchantia polymorpha]